MWLAIFISFIPSWTNDPGLAAPHAAFAQEPDHKAEYEEKRKEAEGSVEKLWHLYEWCQTNKLEKEGRSTLRAILKVDPEHKQAHELLGEVYFDSKWFANESKVEEYKRKQLEAEAKKSGKAVYKGELVDPADIPFLERGLVKDPSGQWIDVEAQKKVAEGWVHQDLEWVPPDQKDQIGKGLWKCGDDWLALDDANKFHADVGRWWRLPGEHFVVYSTCRRDIAERALSEAERSYKDLVRIFGRAPAGQVMFLVLNSGEQYNRFATAENATPVELRGFSSLHGAFLAEVWQEPSAQGWPSAGVAFWDASSDAGNSFGPTFVRHAAAQSFAEALDPSPKMLASRRAGSQANANDGENFWKEKSLPSWFRYGGCTYVERYFVDNLVPASGDPLWARKWSVANVASKGGLDPLDRIFTFPLSLDDIPGSQKLINEVGLVVAFVLDGKCEAVSEKHAALAKAVASGKDVEKAARALEEALKANEGELRKFAAL